MHSRIASTEEYDATATVDGPADRVLVDRKLADFVDEHYDRLLHLARLVCRDPTDAADAVQAGLEQSWRRRRSLRDDERMRPWLDRIIVRAAIRVADRRRSWLRRIFSTEASVNWAEPSATDVHIDATWLSLDAAFERLKPAQRAVVALHLYAGYTVVETAELVQAPVETVRSRLRLARENLRQAVEEADA